MAHTVTVETSKRNLVISSWIISVWSSIISTIKTIFKAIISTVVVIQPLVPVSSILLLQDMAIETDGKSSKIIQIIWRGKYVIQTFLKSWF